MDNTGVKRTIIVKPVLTQTKYNTNVIINSNAKPTIKISVKSTIPVADTSKIIPIGSKIQHDLNQNQLLPLPQIVLIPKIEYTRPDTTFTRPEILSIPKIEYTRPDTIPLKLNIISESNKISKSPGLVNIGNTCFHNSIAQLFHRMVQITNFIIQPIIIQQYNDPYFIAFMTLLKLMHNNFTPEENNYLSTNLIGNLVLNKICPILGKSYIPGHQADSKELLQILLDRMTINCVNTALNINKSELCKINTFIDEDGDQIKVVKPRYKFPEQDPRNLTNITVEYYFNGTKLDISNNINMLDIRLYKYQVNDINQLLQQYQNDYDIQQIRDDNGILAFYTNFVIKPNGYLIIGLDLTAADGSKINHNIYLNSNIILNNTNYELIGFVAHAGILQAGHYIAYIKYNNTWFLYDDETISKVNSKDAYKITNFIPYILLYQDVNITQFKPIININTDLYKYLIPI